MKAANTSIIVAILCISILCAIESQTPKTSNRRSKAKVQKDSSKGAKCGRSVSAPNEGRIIGGVDAIPHSWPWQVSIDCRGSHKCGGSIISDKWIITAAHCVNPNEIDVRRYCQIIVGKHDLQRNESTQMSAKIADYSKHEDYDSVNFKNGYDLALIKLAKPLKFTGAIQPICLPFGLPELPTKKRCYATGWGYTGAWDTPTQILVQLSMAIEVGFCERVRPRPTDRIICTTSWDVDKDVCEGDSGGPLACQEDDGKWYLRGALSWGPGNCALWAIFTKVASYEDWIKKITSG